MNRRTFLTTTGAVAAGVAVTTATPAVAAASDRRFVRTLDELGRALATAGPGTTITVADGHYPVTDPIAITNKRGRPGRPITLRAESIGGVVLTGAQSFVFSASADITLQGFAFRQSTTLELPPDCRRIRLTRNDFQLADLPGLHWLMVRADHSTIDHNAFHGKTTLGIYLGIEGAGTDQMAQGVHVYRNHFSDHSFPGDNGGEPIRLGVSPRALSTAGAVIESNLFERANGDPEAISVKSSGNVIRHNTIRDSFGGIVLRHGNDNRVEGNYLLAGKNGIRIYGNDHLIVNNYVERIAGTGVVLGSGNVRDHFPGEPPTSRTGNDAPDGVEIVLNTVLDCQTAISGESHRTLPPLGCTIADNLLVAESGQLLNVPFQDGITWSGNLHWGAASDGNAPAAGFRRLDPKLAAGPDGVRRLTAGSPAINAASRSYRDVEEDLDGDRRTRRPDVGADEFSRRRPCRGPLTAADVGPHSA
ncbi:lyase precursor [Kribbella sandramycini]|uniref:Lyase n=1 Tax=Kribbella sandramycini TaxID=60450 RepID=A0A7Y4KYF9_9ACTN|nr:polysaccharide lyase 6 family protein [Kribbella sandramycini]MBB6569214.1 poly(beta-D-mannuronate) lyase [Kribbella sandramycini]NOL40945.1 lyase precursor [Kribbella sandramycini]